MPIRIDFRKDGGILAEVTGKLRAKDLIGLNDSLYDNPEHIRAIRCQICDLTGVTEVDVPSEEMARLAQQDTQAADANPNMLIALVGNRDLTFGLARMWEAHAAGPELETVVFRRRDEAERWICGKLEDAAQTPGPPASQPMDARSRPGSSRCAEETVQRRGPARFRE